MESELLPALWDADGKTGISLAGLIMSAPRQILAGEIRLLRDRVTSRMPDSRWRTIDDEPSRYVYGALRLSCKAPFASCRLGYYRSPEDDPGRHALSYGDWTYEFDTPEYGERFVDEMLAPLLIEYDLRRFEEHEREEAERVEKERRLMDSFTADLDKWSDWVPPARPLAKPKQVAAVVPSDDDLDGEVERTPVSDEVLKQMNVEAIRKLYRDVFGVSHVG